MKNAKKTYSSRDEIMKLLSDTEVAKVSTAETAEQLGVGDEYIDLTDLGAGVRRAIGPDPLLGRLLPKKAVHEKTWKKILAKLPAHSAA